MSLIRTALSVEPESRFTLFYGNRDSNSVIFLEALAALKDRYLGRFELYHFLSDEEGDVDLFNGMLDRETCDEAIEHLVDDPASGRRLVHLRARADDGCGRSSAARSRTSRKDRIHIERFTAGRPSAALAAQMAQLQEKAAGLTLSVTLDGRTRKVEFTEANILDSAREAGLAGAIRLQGRRLRDLPGQGHQGQGRNGRALRPDRRGNRRRLCPDLPVGAGGRGRGGRL